MLHTALFVLLLRMDLVGLFPAISLALVQERNNRSCITNYLKFCYIRTPSLLLTPVILCPPSFLLPLYLCCYLSALGALAGYLPAIHKACIWYSSLKPTPRCKKRKPSPAENWHTGWGGGEDTSFPYWRYLHILSEPLLDSADVLFANDDIWSLIGPHSSPIMESAPAPDDFPQAGPQSVTQRLPFVCHIDGTPTTLDLTRILQTSDLIRFQSVYHFKSTHGLPLIFDTGASITVSPHLKDFVGPLQTSGLTHSRLNGVNSSHLIKGMGTIRVLVYTDNHQPRYIETTGYYVPDINVRLFSVQRYIDEHPGEQCVFSLSDNGMQFIFPTTIGGGKLTFNYQSTNHLPVAETFLSSTTPTTGPSKTFQVVDSANTNLSRGQKALLKVHYCLGHINFQWIQHLIRHNFVTFLDPNVSLSSSSDACLCTACQFAKQTRKPDGSKIQHIREKADGALKDNNLRPGSCVSTDQFVSSIPGRLATSFGRERLEDKLVGGTVFVDHASGFIFVQNQASLSAPATIRSKHLFERTAMLGGVQILAYKGDNGIYRSQEFRSDLESLHQSIDFSAVGAHHQNGIAERAIRTISDCARSMLLHALIHWPHETSLDLWPFAVDYAVYLWNHMPRRDCNKAPIELFYDSSCDVKSILSSAKCWGCPAYVLDPTLQDGKKLPRWSPKSKLGQFLGRSREHADSAGRIRNLRTNAISAQFHVVYDNFFTTIFSDVNHDNVPVPPNFDTLLRFSTENLFHPDDIASYRRQQTASQLDRIPSSNQREIPASASPQSSSKDPPLFSSPPREPSIRWDPSLQPEAPLKEPVPSSHLREPLSHLREPSPSSSPPLRELPPLREQLPSPLGYESDSSSSSSSIPAPVPLLRRSSRSTKGQRSTKYSSEFQGDFYASYPNSSLLYHDAFLIDSNLSTRSDSLTVQYSTLHLWKLDLDDEQVSLGTHPLAFSARANAEDTPRWHEAMRSPDREGFIEAMYAEWDQLVRMNAFRIVPRQRALDMGKRVVDSTWAFRRKRYPDGSVKKLKARLCVRGDQMVDLNPFDTYSPVVAWSTIRLMLIMAVILDLKTTQVDYTNAFVQAKAAPGTFIEMPRMFEKQGFILELNRNLYGQRDAPIRFFEHLKDGLSQRQFTQSVNDRCLFISHDVIVLTYVDDCIFFSKKQKKIDALIDSLRNPKSSKHIAFTLNVESDYEGFLGIDIRPSKTVTGALELLQIGLIDRIITALDLDDDDVAIRKEPAAAIPIGKDESGPPRRESWSYPSVVGMLLYLASNSRPDIAFAVHQCARFSHCPRSIHEQAVKRIARYLKGTRSRGLIMKPNQNLNLEMFADADFAGLWNAEEPHDPVCVKSRSGYIIYLSDVPVLWSSKLQTEIATSTMHAEYIALSSGMRELLPVRNVFYDVCSSLNIHLSESAKVIKVHEDNEGALKLAQSPIMRVTPHSKHFAVKYHWFRERLDEYKIELVRVATDQQKADIFTKGLIGKEFETKRFMLMGW